MSNTNSISFPNMFNVSQGTVGVIEDNVSIVNRCRLLMLTDPTELYNSPNFGVGMRKHLFTYNTENQKSILKNDIKEQLRIYEPCVDADKTTFVDGLLFTEPAIGNPSVQDHNKLNLTIGLYTIFGDNIELPID